MEVSLYVGFVNNLASGLHGGWNLDKGVAVHFCEQLLQLRQIKEEDVVQF